MEGYTEVKRGIRRIAWLDNHTHHLDELKQQANISHIDVNDFDKLIENQINEKNIQCFDLEGTELDSESSDISFFLLATGYSNDNEEPLYALLWRKSPDKLVLDENGKNIGVRYGKRDELVKLGKEYTSMMYLQHVYCFPESPTKLCAIFNDTVNGSYSTEAFKDLVCKSLIEAKMEKTEHNIKTPFGDSILMFPLIKQEEISQDDQLLVTLTITTGQDSTCKKIGPRIQTLEELKYDISLQYYRQKGYYTVGAFLFDNKFSSISFLETVAKMAMPEDWDGPAPTEGDADYDQVLPVLRSYLIHTYHRLRREEPDKIVEANGKCYFNSGLINRCFRQIIIVGDIQPDVDLGNGLGSSKSNLLGNMQAYSENHWEIANVLDHESLPKPADFFEGKLANVIFDADLEVHINDNHVFLDGMARNRLPIYADVYKNVQKDEERLNLLVEMVSAAFEEALRRARMLAQRNYKLAVPQYWKSSGKGEIQFLLPIYLDSPEQLLKDENIHREPSCALVLSQYKNGNRTYYRGETILTLRMAYKNARLLARPDVFWLTSTANIDKGLSSSNASSFTDTEELEDI